MFAGRFYPSRFFANRYFPKVGAEAVPDVEGPGFVVAAQLYFPGAKRTQVYFPGPKKAQVYHPGAKAVEVKE